MAGSSLTAAEILAAFQSTSYSIEDRVAFVRALRDTTPGMVSVDPRLTPRVRAAKGVRDENIDATINALESSEFWQKSADTTPQELRDYRTFDEKHRPLIDALRSFVLLLLENTGYQRLLAVDKVRAVFKAGQAISGDAAIAIRPHLELIAETRPTTGRRRKKSEAPPAPAAPNK